MPAIPVQPCKGRPISGFTKIAENMRSLSPHRLMAASRSSDILWFCRFSSQRQEGGMMKFEFMKSLNATMSILSDIVKGGNGIY